MGRLSRDGTRPVARHKAPDEVPDGPLMSAGMLLRISASIRKAEDDGVL